MRFFDLGTASAATRHLNIIGIANCSAEGIFVGLEQTFSCYQIPLLSFISDTYSVMKGAIHNVPSQKYGHYKKHDQLLLKGN